jgi:hypothetical protein
VRPGAQIDRLVARQTGSGSTTTASFSLPRALYTVFVAYDPPESVKSFAVVRQQDGPVPNSNAVGVRRAGDVIAPLVQHELPAGSYHVEIGTLSRTCSWDVQVVLNKMLSWRRPPRAWKPSAAPPHVIRMRSDDDPTFLLTQTGRYEPSWTVGPDPRQHASHPYSVDLRAADGHTVHLGVATATGGRSVGFLFLGAGQWTVEMKTDFEWEFALTPVVGPTGGGARAF